MPIKCQKDDDNVDVDKDLDDVDHGGGWWYGCCHWEDNDVLKYAMVRNGQ